MHKKYQVLLFIYLFIDQLINQWRDFEKKKIEKRDEFEFRLKSCYARLGYAMLC